MTSKRPPPQAEATGAEEACGWVVRRESASRTRDDDAQFHDWLEQDPENASRFAEGSALWNALGALKDSPEAHAALEHLYDAGAVRDVRPTPWIASRRALLGGGVAALAAGLASLFILPRTLLDRPLTFETSKGEQRRIVLSDGTTAMLDTATRIAVEMHHDQRLITLDHGQAFFDVAHDPARPFRVFAGDDEIRALGTAFQVRFENGAATVILEEGRVAVFSGGTSTTLHRQTPASGLEVPHATLVLRPGQATELSGDASPKAVPVDLSDTGAWRNGELVFDDVPLSAAVAEVNRYGGPTIVLADRSVGELRISGTFHTNQPRDFVEGVTAALPVRLEQASAARLLLQRI